MAELLKNFYNKTFFEHFLEVFERHAPGLDKKGFLKKTFDEAWEDRTLKERMRHTAITMQDFLPKDYDKAVAIVVQLAKSFRQNPIDGNQSFAYISLADYVAVFGLDHLHTSIKAMEEITQLISCEFAVRPFLKKYPAEMHQQMLDWAKHPSEQVRRLASEGYRPRLPWGMGIPSLKKDPSPIFLVLELLKNDPSETVRRSVANNLNDISKDHPDLVLRLAKEWYGKNENTDRLIKHACRSLLKKGYPEAMILFGFSPPDTVRIQNLTLSSDSVQIGDKLEFSFAVSLDTAQAAKLRLEYGIDYQKANGKYSRKIFQLSEKVFPPKKLEKIKKRQSFADMTTRKHYPGTHHLVIIVNGIEMVKRSFEVED